LETFIGILATCSRNYSIKFLEVLLNNDVEGYSFGVKRIK